MEENMQDKNGENMNKNRNIKIGCIVLAAIVILAIALGVISSYRQKKFLDQSGQLISDVMNQASNSQSSVQDAANNFINGFADMVNNVSSQLDDNEAEYDGEKEKSDEEKEKFNVKFTLYKGTKKGLALSNILGDVIASNNENERQISVKFDGKVVNDTASIKNIMANIDYMATYIISFKYDSDGYINMMVVD